MQNVPYLINLIQNEIKQYQTNAEAYWGTEEDIENSNKIFELLLDWNIVTEEYMEDRWHKMTNLELLEAALDAVLSWDYSRRNLYAANFRHNV